MKQTNNNGIGFIGALTILFVGLKLTGFINWSWWWVFSPMLAGTVLVIILIALYIWANK